MCRSLGISHALRLCGGGRLLAEPILSVSLKTWELRDGMGRKVRQRVRMGNAYTHG